MEQDVNTYIGHKGQDVLNTYFTKTCQTTHATHWIFFKLYCKVATWTFSNLERHEKCSLNNTHKILWYSG